LAGEMEAQQALTLAESQLARPQVDLSAIEAQEQAAQATLLSAREQEGRIQGQLHGVSGALSKMQGQTAGKCSQCGQTVTAEHLAAEVAALQTQVQSLSAPLPQLQNQAKVAQVAIQSFQGQKATAKSQAEEAYRQAQGQVAAMRARVASYNGVRASVDRLGADLARLRQEWVQIKDEQNPFAHAEADTQIKIQGLRATVEQSEKAMATNDAATRYADFWVTALANKGLKSYILDQRIGEMSDAANKWVQLLTGGTIWIRFETQKMGRSTKRLSNDMNIRVFRYNTSGTTTERNYKSWSGGEKRRVSWAIDFGLSRLVAARAKKRWDALILDEVFKHVDQKGGEAIAEMLAHLRRERPSIFVIEHDGNFQSQFEQRVLIRKQNGSSTILEDNNEQQKTGWVSDSQQSQNSEDTPERKKKQAAPRKRRVSPRSPASATKRRKADSGTSG